MTSLNLSAGMQLLDAALSAGFSAALWLVYDLLVTLLGLRSRIASAVFHVLFFSLSGVVGFCFIVGRTSLAIPRWYLALGFLVGCGAYYLLLSRPLRWLVRAMKKAVVWLLRPLTLPFRWLAGAAGARLQRRRERVYNAHMQRRRLRAQQHGEEKNGEQSNRQNKKPIQAYKKT